MLLPSDGQQDQHIKISIKKKKQQKNCPIVK